MITISRKGTGKDHGSSKIQLNDSLISWNSLNKTICIGQDGIEDFRSKSHHDYNISISLNEIAEILNAIAEEGLTVDSENTETIISDLLPSLRSIIQLSNKLTEPPNFTE